MSKIVPTISSGTAGPLGVLHLPRLWQKACLGAQDKLHDDYPACGQGYDQMTIDALGVDRDAMLSFISSEKPSYVEFENWIAANGSSVTPEAIAAHNAAVEGYIHADETRAEIFAGTGQTDESCSFRDAVNLNNLDDWAIFHAQELS